VGGFFNPKPADLTSSTVQSSTPSDIFLIITQGSGQMPSIRENLTPEQRWDVVNFVFSLKK
jgi:hypothetical protein